MIRAFRSFLFLALALTAIGCNGDSLTKMISDYGMVRVHPPRAKLEPGTVVVFSNQTSGKNAIKVVCWADQAFPGAGDPETNDTATMELKKKLQTEIGLEANYLTLIKAEAKFKRVKGIDLNIKNAAVVEYADADLIGPQKNRIPECSQAIQKRKDSGEPVYYLLQALRADVVYKVRTETEASTGAEVKLDEGALADLSVKLGGSVGSISDMTIVGNGLNWGVGTEIVASEDGMEPRAAGEIKGLERLPPELVRQLAKNPPSEVSEKSDADIIKESGQVSAGTTGGEESNHHKGYALAIGLNSVDPDHYQGWSGELTGCEPDADVMETIAKGEGFEVKVLKTKEAKRDRVLAELEAAAEKLEPGDLFVLSYSGHGGQLPDENGDEADSYDETWCLYDGELLDDELYGALGKFKKGVRVLAFSDSCHSGTVLKANLPKISEVEKKPKAVRDAKMRKLRSGWKARTRLARPDKEKYFKMKGVAAVRDPKFVVPQPVEKAIPPDQAVKVYLANKEFYQRIGRQAPVEDPAEVAASVILISGCEDDQYSADMGFNGLFTASLRSVWNKGEFKGDHHGFHEAIRELVQTRNSDQSPKFFTINQDEAFENQRPYTVEQ